MTRDVVILDGARTAIGTFGGALAGTPPIATAAHVARAAMARSGVEGGQIGHVVFGHVINTEPRDMYLSRVAAIEAGIPDTTPAMNVNRLCGSGAQAVVSAMQAIMLGDADFALAGGAESMSRSPHLLHTARFGQKMGDATMVDMMLGALNCPFGTGHMGVTAENIAEEMQITRPEQDAFAVESHRRAVAAMNAGRFADEIVAISVPRREGAPIRVERDEHPRCREAEDGRLELATSLEDMAKLKPAFRKGGTVTAGNSSGVNDGAAALLLASRDKAEELGLGPKLRWLGSAAAGVDPGVMGYGPVPATEKLLARFGLTIDNIGLVELHEAFAAQAIGCMRRLGLNRDKTNVNGGAIALGHPTGCSGARILVTLMHEMARRAADAPRPFYGLATLCVGVGMGVSTLVEWIGD